MYKLEANGDTFEVVQTFDSGVGIQHHFPDDCPDGCCVDDCCNCSTDCGVCYCHQECDEEQVN